ncbi:hypothetical protein DL770_011846 [Monosporascus sp. CRB-9-2]|nr:hypothetical protein DL770_011846 [Monosporascus sp. CRB-9-2]
MSDTESNKSTNKKVEKKGEKKENLVHRHKTMPTYYPFDNKYVVDLEPGSYMPRDLINFSVKTFWLREDDDLSLRHEDARKGFTGAFLQSRAKFDQELQGGKTLNAQIRDVNNLRTHIDNFFFFGQLRDHLDVDFGMDVVTPTEDGSVKEGWNGYTVLRGDRCHLKVNIGSKNQIFPLMTVAETLVHEMAHAYLMLFSARNCEKCDKARLSTIGLPGDGHGLIFQMLHRIMVTTIREWDDGLKDLAAKDCPGLQVSQSARALARQAYKALPSAEKDAYRKQRSLLQTQRDLIRITDDDEVLVDLNLRRRALQAEEDIRVRKSRVKENDRKQMELQRREKATKRTAEEQ